MRCHLIVGHILGATVKLGIVSACLVLFAPMSAQERKPQATLEGHTEAVESLSFSPDGKTLASGSRDHSIKLWDVATGRNTTTLKEKKPYLWGAVAFSPNGKALATGGWYNKVKLWEVGFLKGTLLLDEMKQCPPPMVVFSSDGKTLASGSMCIREIRVWDLTTHRQTATLAGHDELGVKAMIFLEDGKTLASFGHHDGDNGEIKLWDVATGKNTATLRITDEVTSAAAFSPDGKSLATAIRVIETINGINVVTDNSIKLWNVATGKERATLKVDTARVASLVFSPDGKTLASGSEDARIKLWEVATGKERATLQGHTGAVVALAFSPDGKTLASGSKDKRIKLWDL